jgi:hypothetical protein
LTRIYKSAAIAKTTHTNGKKLAGKLLNGWFYVCASSSRQKRVGDVLLLLGQLLHCGMNNKQEKKEY